MTKNVRIILWDYILLTACCYWVNRTLSTIYYTCMVFGDQNEPTSVGRGGGIGGLLQSCLHKPKGGQCVATTQAKMMQPHLCKRTHARTHTRTHAHTHARTHTHTHTHSRSIDILTNVLTAVTVHVHTSDQYTLSQYPLVPLYQQPPSLCGRRINYIGRNVVFE